MGNRTNKIKEIIDSSVQTSLKTMVWMIYCIPWICLEKSSQKFCFYEFFRKIWRLYQLTYILPTTGSVKTDVFLKEYYVSLTERTVKMHILWHYREKVRENSRRVVSSINTHHQVSSTNLSHFIKLYHFGTNFSGTSRKQESLN